MNKATAKNRPAKGLSLQKHQVVSREEWLVARRELLAQEKEFTRLRDRLSQLRRELPWVKVDKNYVFAGPHGEETLADLFDGRSQLIVYHFMFHPDWHEGCKSCSFWADNFNGIIVHLNHRDVTMVAISRAPLEKLEAFKRRMDWSFKWLSSFSSDFNYDFDVSFTPEQIEKGTKHYNYEFGSKFPSEEGPGISVFYRNEEGGIFHTYSCYARGLDMLNVAYHYLDLVPKGRDEGDSPQAWVRYRDKYDA
ncbi:MAG TPA: thioredoxin family protein [Dehalococcoidia bacterium]|nr:thioredoxin family protein [Dehalococcoidia bacterium]